MTRGPLVNRDVGRLVAVVALMFAGVAVLLPVTPVLVERESGSGTAAGVANGLFFATTVIAQLATPRLMRSVDGRLLMAVGVALLGGPAIAAAAGEGWEWLTAATALRGVGFGLVTVVSFAVVAELAPAARRAEALGLAGLAVGVPNVFGPSLGLWLLSSGGRATTLVVGGTVTLAGALPLRGLPRCGRAGRGSGTGWRGVREPALLRPFAALTIVTLAFGAILTFVPVVLPEDGPGSAAVFLLCSGALAFVARWLSGRIADRVGAHRVLAPGLAVTTTGLVVLAGDRSTAGVILAGVLFGAGFGVAQTGLQGAIFGAAGERRYALASVLWNIGLDAGVGIGAVALALVASAFGYDAMLWVLPVLAAAALLVSLVGARSPEDTERGSG